MAIHRLTAVEKLAALVREMANHVEHLGCTCVDPDRLHASPGRRRKDANCTGLALAVEAELKVRRLVKLARAERRRTV